MTENQIENPTDTDVESRLAVRIVRSSSDDGHRGSRSRIALLLVAALLVVIAGLLYVVNQRDADAEVSAEKARAVATTHVEELLSYDYRHIDDEFAKEKAWLTGDFAEEYTPLISDRFGPQAAKAKLVTQARVVAGGVESAGEDEVQLLLFVNVAVERAGAPPSVTGSRLRVTVQDVDGEWRISALEPI